MDITYELCEFNGEKFIFRLNDGRWIAINLAKDFPTYKIPSYNLGIDKWHFTAQESNSFINKGDVKLFDREYVRSINILCKSFYNSNVLFTKTTQIELDRFESKLNPITDNGRFYLLMMKLIDKDIEKKSKIRTTLII